MQEDTSHFLRNMDNILFNTKPHVWDEDMRLELATTIGRSYAIDNNETASKKQRLL